MSRKHRIQSHYDPRARDHLPGHEVADWASTDAQQARFAAMLDRVNLAERSILDIGCGTGDLWAEIVRRGLADVDYLGVDLSQAVIATAGRRHPRATFAVADVFAAPRDDAFPDGGFDVVFASGIFNLHLGNNEAFIARAAATMLRLSRIAAVFNFLDTRAVDRVSYCHYYRADTVAEALRQTGIGFELVDGYLPYDTTMICRCGEAS